MRICAPCFLVSLTLILDEQNLSDDNLDVRANCDSTILKNRESKLAARCHMDNTASWPDCQVYGHIQDQKVDSLAD